MKRLLALSIGLVLSATQCYATTYSLWYPNAVTHLTWTGINSTQATKVKFLKQGTVTGLAYYKDAGDTTTSRNFIIWAEDGTNVAECSSSGEATGTSQWVSCNLATPFPVSAYSTYYVSYDIVTNETGSYINVSDGCDSAGSGGSNLSCVGAITNNTAISTFPNAAQGHALLADVIFAPCP